MKVLVICARRYNGNELWTSLGILKNQDVKFDLVSTDYIIQDEITMQPNKITKLVHDVDPKQLDEYSGVMIVSGNMADTEAYWKNSRVLSIFESANADNKAIAAICCSVPTIRGVARGKGVSFFPLVRSRELLKNAGALLRTVALTRDQNLVTAEHQMATQMWAEEYCNLLYDKPTQYILVDSGYVPKGNPRKPIASLELIKERRATSGIHNSQT
jgi:putative intracellular protease/amidase